MKIVLLTKADVRHLTRKDIVNAGRKNAEKCGDKDELIELDSLYFFNGKK
ncbi:hypothetical protein NE619_08085 [Anaerovorax odorimutans]|uniref:Uncharacterized protein n=1 Tax=Anaerovorax odorimutans TaxID=109327 RepID=A0ABT1RP45_9FIRM|nr:hypothetical protein [Anaerovorax odorimutans]MCQ4636686.1 hypothetical protein [Anaerovorax odorimutans]